MNGENVKEKKKNPVLGLVGVLLGIVTCLAMSVIAFASEATPDVVTTMSTAATAAATQAQSMITTLLPITMGVVTSVVVVTMGIRLFKRFMR